MFSLWPYYKGGSNDWLKTINKKLDIAQCNDREKVLYASGKLEGSASDWWDAYIAAHQESNTITWLEFTDAFHTHHVPAGLIELRLQEINDLKQPMSVCENRDRFIQLSRYTTDEINTDAKK